MAGFFQKVFGFSFSKENEGPKTLRPDDFIRKLEDGDTVVVSAQGDHIQYTANFQMVFKDSKEKIESYRRLSMTTYVDAALDDIVDEAVDFDKFTGESVKIKLDRTKFSDDVKSQITQEFEEVLELLGYNKEAPEFFREWLVDGVQYFYVVPHENQAEGIKEVRKLDARFIKRVKKISFDAGRSFQENLQTPKEEVCYVFMMPDQSEHELSWIGAYRSQVMANEAVEIKEEAVIYSDSGLYDVEGKVISVLDKALKPFNQLSMLEDATVIYRISRAPERRVFYIDVGDLNPKQAEGYLKSIIAKFRSKMSYDVKTGLTNEQYDVRNMMEDIWLPRGTNGKSTEVTTLQAGQNLGEIEDVQYFRKKLYKALKIPVSRLEAESSFNLGRSAEITRDEVRFSKYVRRLSNKFSALFYEVLKRQLVLKNIVTPEEWNDERAKIEFTFMTNSYFEELKNLEITAERITRLGEIDPWVGKYYTKKYVQSRILNMTEEEIKEINEVQTEEVALGLYEQQGGATAIQPPPPPEEGAPGEEIPGEDFSPEPAGEDFSPAGEDFSPEEADFSPEPADFSPEGEDFSPEIDDEESVDPDEEEDVLADK